MSVPKDTHDHHFKPSPPVAAPLVLTAVAASGFLATFNETFLNVALAPIMSDYAINAVTVQWVATAYMLVAAVTVPLTGFLYRRFPAKNLMLTALTLLFVGSLVGLFAVNFPTVILARIIQASGTGMVGPLGMNLTLAVAPRHQLGTYMGVVSAMTTLGPAFGPIVTSGIMAVFDWHVLFAVFAGLTALVLTVSIFAVPNPLTPTSARLDWTSTGLASVGLIGFMYGVSLLFSADLLLGLGSSVLEAILLAAFLWRQGRCDNPLLDLRPFTIPAFNLGVVAVVLTLMTVFSVNMVLPIFMQSMLGFSVLQSAQTLLVPCLVSCVLAPVAGKIFDKQGLRVMAPGGTIVIIACLLGMTVTGTTTSPATVVVLYAPLIAGCAMVLGPMQSFALSHLPASLYPHGTTIVATAFQLAGCVGSSLFGHLFAVTSSFHAAGPGLIRSRSERFPQVNLVGGRC